MSIWGKLAGAATGLALGGPFAALIGGVAGHLIVDRDNDAEPDKQIAFTMGVIALGAKMAKSDGHVTREEVEAFKQVFKVPEAEAHNVARIFDLVKRDIAGYESYAKQLAALFKDDTAMLHNILEGLFHIAEADGRIPEAERIYLATVARHFGISDSEFKYLAARHIPSERNSAYDVLGVASDVTDDDLRRHYRQLLQDNHPDKLMSSGLPQEFIDIATRKIVAFNAAYTQIRQERRI
jgi:DnaJ like chaperone protein